MTRTRTTRTPRGQHAHPFTAWGHAGSRRAGAFSLMEVLIALGIFALGLVAVAAVFPTAIAIQSETVRDLAGQRAVINARSTIQAIARSYETNPSGKLLTLTYEHDVIPSQRKGTLRDFTVANTDMLPPANGRTGFPSGVQPMIEQPLPWNESVIHGTPYNTAEISPTAFPALRINAPRSFHDLFSLDVRSYPKNITDVYKRDYYWYPFIQPRDLTSNNPTWMVYLVVMQRHGTEAVPEVRAAAVDTRSSVTFGKQITFTTTPPDPAKPWEVIDNDLNNNGLPDLIQPGDYVLGDDGTIFRVVVAERNRITVDSIIPINGNLNYIYYAVALDGLDGSIKRESRSAVVRIEQFEIVVNQP